MIDKTPTPEVLLMNRVAFSGNIIPHSWYQKLKFTSGKANLPAIVILAEICYWYRPVEVRDETTGELVKLEKKFYSDKLQRKYESFESLGLTKKQAYDACHFLQEAGLINLETRTITTKTGVKIPNVLFIGVNPREISNLNQPLKEGETALPTSNEPLPTSNVPLPTSNDALPTSNTCTESTVLESTSETSTSFAVAIAPQTGLVKLPSLPLINSKDDVVAALLELEVAATQAEDIAKSSYPTKSKDLIPEEGDLFKVFNRATHIISAGAINWGAEGRHCKTLIKELRSASYTAKDVINCIAWGYWCDKYSFYKMSATSVTKLMPMYLDEVRTGKILERFNPKKKFETTVERNERIATERNKEEIIKNAARFDEERAAVFGTKRRPVVE